MRYFLVLFFGVSLFFSAVAQNEDKPNYYVRPQNPPQQSPELPRDTTSRLRPSTQLSYTKKKFDWSNILIEPNIQFFVGNGYIQFGLQPSVVYKVWKKGLYAGGSLHYNVLAQPNYAFAGVNNTIIKKDLIRQQTFGGGVVLHYNIWKGIYARIRPEILGVRIAEGYEVSANNKVKIITKDYVYPHLWLGAGYNFTRNKTFFIPIGVFFDPLYYVRAKSQFAPYQSPIYIQLAFYIFSPRL